MDNYFDLFPVHSILQLDSVGRLGRIFFGIGSEWLQLSYASGRSELAITMYAEHTLVALTVRRESSPYKPAFLFYPPPLMIITIAVVEKDVENV